MGHLLSVILPVYKQADHINQIVQEYGTVLGRLSLSYEFILVVNGATDNSLEVCRALEAQSSTVRVIHTTHSGWGRAVRLGLDAAQGDLLCYTNSARTNPQDLVLLLMYAVAYPNVVVKANRKIRENWQRRLGSLLYNLECRALFDLSCWDINGTPKVFPRAFSRLLELTENGDLIDAEFNVICRQEGYPMIEVPIFASRRHGGKSTTNYNSALAMYWGVCQLWWKLRRADP